MSLALCFGCVEFEGGHGEESSILIRQIWLDELRAMRSKGVSCKDSGEKIVKKPLLAVGRSLSWGSPGRVADQYVKAPQASD